MNKLANKKLLHVALCGVLSSALAGCKTDTQTPVEQTALTDRAWQPIACDSEFQMDLLSGLGVAQNIDGLVIFRGGVQTAPQATVVGGQPCSQALDVEFCQSLLDEAIIENENQSSSLIVTSGDDVWAVQGKDRVLEFLGELDTPEKVFVWMHVNKFEIGCTLDQAAVARAEDRGGWYGFYTRYSSLCAPVITERVEVAIGIDGSIDELSRVEVSNIPGLCIGRVPPGRLSIADGRQDVDVSALGKMFAKHAAYEAASVVAFVHLKDELAYYGAPQSILDKLQEAANDETRHAQQVGDLAQAYGCDSDEFHIEPSPRRSLDAIAMDNLVEGCIGETWGALVGLYQAQNAQSSDVRETMRQIATDEVGHAALSWEIHEWLIARLSDSQRQKVARARAYTIAQLKTRIEQVQRHAFELQAGLPTPEASAELFNHFSELVNARSLSAVV